MFDIRVKTKDFLRAIRIVANAIVDDKIDGKNSGVYIEALEDTLVFRGIGNNLFIKCGCEAKINETGNILIKYKLIEEFLRKVEEEFVEIKETGSSIKISAKGTNTTYNLLKYEKPLDVSITNGVEYILDKKIFLESMENSQFAASNDETKRNINCLKFDVEEKILKLVSTDSYRLMYSEIEIDENVTNESLSVSIPLKAIQSLQRIFKESKEEKVSLKSEGTRVLFKIGDIEILTKIVEIQFPDYENIIKSAKRDKVIRLNKADFKKKLEMVQLFVKDKTERKDVAEFLFKGSELIISGFNDVASIEQKLKVVKDCDDIKFYLNVKYLLDYVNTIKNSEIIRIDMSDEFSIILLTEDIKGNNDKFLTMPLKI